MNYLKFELKIGIGYFKRELNTLGQKNYHWKIFLQNQGFCKIKFCNKIDVNLVSDVPQKPTIAHWKAFGVSNLPNKSKM